MSLEHGLLNLPLHKRGGGNINAQLDRHKADLRAQRKADAKQRTADRKQARELIAAASEERLDRLAAKAGLPRTKLVERLRSLAHFTPSMVIAGLGTAAQP